MVGLTLQKLDLDQEVFIVKFLQFFQKFGTVSKSSFKVASVVVQTNQASFQGLRNLRKQIKLLQSDYNSDLS